MSGFSRKQRTRIAIPTASRSVTGRRFAFLLIGITIVSVVVGYGFYVMAPVYNEKAVQKNSMIVEVVSRSVAESLDLVGTVEPGKVVNVMAPFDGPVREQFVDFGMRINRGQALLSIDASELELKISDAKAPPVSTFNRSD